jgi:DNA-binding transcriptional regulator YiaG
MDLGLTQRALGQLFGTGPETISSWENHHTAPTPKHLPAVIWFLGYLPIPSNCTWGEQIALMRKGVGFSHTALAETMCMAPSTVLVWEHQADGPRNRRQAKLEMYLKSELVNLTRRA